MRYYGGKELADSFRTVRKNTLIVAEEISEDHYDFKAAPAVRSVAEMLSHIAVSATRNYELHAVSRVTTFEGFDWGAFTEKRKEEEQQLRTKPQILEALRQEGRFEDEAVIEVVAAVRNTQDITPMDGGCGQISMPLLRRADVRIIPASHVPAARRSP